MSFRNDVEVRERALVQAVGRFLEGGAPEGPLLVLGDASPAVARLFAGVGVDLVRWHRALAPAAGIGDRAASRGGRPDDIAGGVPGDLLVSPWPPEGSWPTVAVRLPRAKDELAMWVHAAAARLSRGGELLVYGANDEGIKPADALIEPIFGPVRTDTVKSRCRVLRARRPEGAWPVSIRGSLSDWRTETKLEIGGRVRPWVSYPGVFSHGRVDAGTRLLVESIGLSEGGPDGAPGAALDFGAALPPGASVLDYGCGSGVLAAGVAEGRADLELHLLDPDTLALEAARENLPRARIHVGTSLEAVGDLRFDLIASNPPYHRGKAEDSGVVRDLIRAAPKHLEPGGSLVMVVQRRLPVEGILRGAFGRIAILGEDGTYRVWEGREPLGA